MNVVLIIVDSLRRDHVGAYGNKWIHTPNLDALSQESMSFMQVYPESTPSIPARRAIHTGLRSFPFRGWHKWSEDDVGLRGWQPVPQNQTMLAEILGDEEFTNVLVTDTLHEFRAFYDFQRGFDVFEFIRGQERDFYRPAWMADQKRLANVLVGGPNESHMYDIARQYLANTRDRKSEEDWFAPRVFSTASNFLEGIKGEQPFFMTVDAYDPHEPWDPPEEYASLYSDGYDGPETLTAPNSEDSWLTKEQLKRMHALYSGEITMMDHWLGNFLDKVRGMGLMENTLLVLVSDHGFAFGEHGYAGKLPSAMYPEITDTVLMIRHPDGRGAGQRSDFNASTHDVAPTILGSMGIDPPQPMDGLNLLPLLSGDRIEERKHATIGYHDWVWARDKRYVMSSHSDGSNARLFDIQKDPNQHNDIAAGNQDVVHRMNQDYVVNDAGGPLPGY